MNKSDLIDAVAEASELTKNQASLAIDAMIDSIANALKDGDSVSLIGFGTFKVSTRSARSGRNPKTGETLEIAESKLPSFKAGSKLKEIVNN